MNGERRPSNKTFNELMDEINPIEPEWDIQPGDEPHWGEPEPAADDLIEWLRAQTWSDFAQSLVESFHTFRSLTPRQRAAAESMRTKCEARNLSPGQRKREERHAQETELDLSGLVSGRYAVPGGDTRLKLKIDVVDKGKWAGWVFVKDAAEYGEGRKYGAQRPGQSYRGDCVEQLRAILADPFEASKAYGKLVGRCGVCGRHLEDAESVAKGIGPICEGRF